MKADWITILYDELLGLNLDKFKSTYRKNTPPTLIKFFNGSYNQDGSNIYLDAVKNNQLWASSPDEFNDPFDCAFNFGSSKNIVREIEDKTTVANKYGISKSFVCETMDVITKVICTPNVSGSVCCFSERQNLFNKVMWGHYANCHKGFAIEYNVEDLNKNDGIVLPILYNNNIDYLPNEIFFGDGMKKLMFYGNILPCIKSKEWGYEREWRIISPKKYKNEKGHLIDVKTPKVVYIGCRASDQLQKDLKKICSNQKIELYQMRMKPNSFELIDEKVDIN